MRFPQMFRPVFRQHSRTCRLVLVAQTPNLFIGVYVRVKLVPPEKMQLRRFRRHRHPLCNLGSRPCLSISTLKGIAREKRDHRRLVRAGTETYGRNKWNIPEPFDTVMRRRATRCLLTRNWPSQALRIIIPFDRTAGEKSVLWPSGTGSAVLVFPFNHVWGHLRYSMLSLSDIRASSTESKNS